MIESYVQKFERYSTNGIDMLVDSLNEMHV